MNPLFVPMGNLGTFLGFTVSTATAVSLLEALYWREKLSSLSEFMREIKVGFARYYSRRHNRRGYFLGGSL